MAGSIVFCKMCKVPLNGEEQFLGHQIMSHELRIEEAKRMWHHTIDGLSGIQSSEKIR